MQGYMTNAAEVTGITSAFALANVIKVEGNVTGTKSKPIPAGAFISHVVAKTEQTVAACAQLAAAITRDAAGDDLVMGPTALTNVWTGLSTGTIRAASFKGDAWDRETEEQDATGELYVHLMTDAGTVKALAKGVQVFWAVRPSVG